MLEGLTTSRKVMAGFLAAQLLVLAVLVASFQLEGTGADGAGPPPPLDRRATPPHVLAAARRGKASLPARAPRASSHAV